MEDSPDRSDRGAAARAARPLLDLLGLAARARALVTGTDAVRRAVRSDEVRRVLLAEDAAPGQRDKLVPLLRARGVPYHVALSQAELGAAIGRAPVSAVGLVNQEFARRAGELIAALPSQQDQARRK